MDDGAHIPSWVALLERRDGLITQLRHDVPARWPETVRHFVSELKAEQATLPPGLAMLLLADLARELDRLASAGANNAGRERLLAAIEAGVDATLSPQALCDQFEEALRHWCRGMMPGSLIPDVQAHRVANYIDQHFAEPITLMTLSRLSGWCSRQLSRTFRASMHTSIRQYVQDARIDHAAALLREGDKVESVLAAVGWRGRKNFFRHFKSRVGKTPAQYRDQWTMPRRARRNRTSEQIGFSSATGAMRQARLAGINGEPHSQAAPAAAASDSGMKRRTG
jgi:AraC-like DNA-binding protein